jgi:hypothetical protein
MTKTFHFNWRTAESVQGLRSIGLKAGLVSNIKNMGNNSEWLISELDKAANPRKWEKVVCAANHYDDGKTHAHQPVGIKTGFVVCGLRRHNCIVIFAIICEKMDNRTRNLLKQSCVQGFITTKNRFVSREEAMEIALNTGQAQDRNLSAPHIGLFSKDLY